MMNPIIFATKDYVKYLVNEVKKHFSLQGRNISTDCIVAYHFQLDSRQKYYNWYTKRQ